MVVRLSCVRVQRHGTCNSIDASALRAPQDCKLPQHCKLLDAEPPRDTEISLARAATVGVLRNAF